MGLQAHPRNYLNGNDHIIGGDGADSLFGNAGDDFLIGNGGKDTLDGEDGNDLLFTNDALADSIKGWAGIDTLYGDTSDTTKTLVEDVVS